jgi:hypothetical protein
MIAIEQLDVSYDAEQQADAAAFAQLFARHIAAHEDQRARAAAQDEHARDERSVPEGSGSW